jgi:opacity protein-like surface antigen
VGDVIEGWSVNTGLRYQFDPGARPGSIKDGPVASIWRTYDWTGPYMGASVGTLRGFEDWSLLNSSSPGGVQPDFAGHVYGGQMGFNLQHGHWVYGIEGEYGISDAHGGVGCPRAYTSPTTFGFPFGSVSINDSFTCRADNDRLALLSARLGIAWGRTLFYAKGGLAVGEVDASASNNGAPGSGGVLMDTAKWSVGWGLGGGMEFALTQRWSAKAEYMHYDLGSEKFEVIGPTSGTPATFVKADTAGDTVRVGINYHFQSEAPVPLK